MEQKNRAILAFFCSFMLVLCIFSMPYGYYTLLRIVITGSAIYIGYTEYTSNGKINMWVTCFAFIAILFNPIIKVHFDRDIWQVIDLICAAVFGVYGYLKKNN